MADIKNTLDDLKKNLAACDAAAAALLKDKAHSGSPLIAAVRVRINAANEALAGHEKWCAANPLAPETTATPAK